MKEENKKEVKKTVLAGAGTAAGAVIASAVENTLNPTHAEAEDTVEAVVAEIAEDASADAPIEADITYAAAPVELDEVVVTAQAASHSQGAHHSHAASHADSHASAFHAEAVADEPIMASVATVASAHDEDVYDDLVVVSHDSPSLHDAFQVHANVTAPAPELPGAHTSSEPLVAAVGGGMDMPDYLSEGDFDVKAEGLGMDITQIDSIDMPDYINNANIDSFTDSI